jgi:hypothetical protein
MYVYCILFHILYGETNFFYFVKILVHTISVPFTSTLDEAKLHPVVYRVAPLMLPQPQCISMFSFFSVSKGDEWKDEGE